MVVTPVVVEVEPGAHGAAPPARSTATYRRVNRFDESLRALTPSAPSAGPAASLRYEVKRGDSLTAIVQRQLKEMGRPAGAAEVYEQVRRVARHNNIGNVDRLSVGQQLDLGPLSNSASAVPAPAPRVEATAPKPVLPSASSAPAKVEVTPISSRPQPTPPAYPAPQTRTIGKAFRPMRREAEPMLLAAARQPVPAGDKAFVLVPKDMEVDGKGGPAGLPMAHYREPGNIVSVVKRVMHIGQQGQAQHAASHAGNTERSPDGATSAVLKTPARLSSGYGMRRDPFHGKPSFHRGVDLAVPVGTEIYPVQPGVVTFSGWQPGYGRIVVVRHENGLETVYAHNSSNLAKVGEPVTTDEAIAKVGTSGRSTGPHLHFEVRREGKAIDPTPYLNPGSWQVASHEGHDH